ncbi:MAG: protein-disulfide reductase DsbD domain-containing protein [Paracoccus sp. (in: a-proteobacteria)]
MKNALILIFLTAFPAIAMATGLPDGLQSATLLPGWTEGGKRISALELILKPGWKTYWRSPGEAGLPPEFEWQGTNIGTVEFHWPAPEVIESLGLRTLGYHDRLVLPFTVTPETDGEPVGMISTHITFGLCENICVPAALTLAAPPPAATTDPTITEAIARQPKPGTLPPACEITKIKDGMTVTLSLPHPSTEIAIEHRGNPGIWVSTPEFSGDKSRASADFITPEGKPFPLDPDDILLTVLDETGATEYRGCTTG